MDRTKRAELFDSLREGRRRFLKQLATTGIAAGAAALPALAQEKSAAPAAPAAASNEPPVAETLARYATSLKYEDIPPEVVRYWIDVRGGKLFAFGGTAVKAPPPPQRQVIVSS